MLAERQKEEIKVGILKLVDKLYYEEEEKEYSWTTNISEQVQFLSGHINEPKLKWYVGRLDENGLLRKHKSYYPHELEKLDVAGGEAYISLLPFKHVDGKMKRSTRNVATKQMLWADLDIGDPVATMDFILYELEEIGEVPPPSAILFSGTGCWAYWRTEPLSQNQWQKLMNVINKRLKPYKADGQAKDLCRYHRLVGTKNRKSNQTVQMQIRDEYLYTVEDFRKYLGLSEDWLEDKKTIKPPKPKGNTKKNVRIFPHFNNLNNTRLEDLTHWLQMRDYSIEGYRNTFIHIYGVELKLANINTITRPVIESILLSINKTFDKPIKVSEIRATTKTLWHNKYKYSSNRIIEKLDISWEEQKEFKTILGTEEKRRRNKLRMREARNSVPIEEYKENLQKEQDERAEEVRKLLEQGHTKKAIQEKLKISKPTLHRICKKYNL